jgi:PAS domain S-box-containing protein
LPTLDGESIFRALDVAGPVGLAAVGLDGVQTYVNRAFCALLGFDENELIGKSPPFPYWPSQEVANIREAFARTMAGEAPPEGFPLRFRRKDDQLVDVRAFIAPLRTASAIPQGWLATVVDVTDRVRSARLLQRSERLLAEAQRIGQLGSWEWDLGTGAVWWSDETYRVFGLDPDSIALDYATYLERIVPGDREHMRAAVSRSLETGGSFVQEVHFVHTDGSLRVLLARGSVERDQSGKPVRMIGTTQDITELRRMEEERARLLAEERERLRLRSILEQLPAGVMIAGRDGGLTYSNPAAAKIFGGDIPSPEGSGEYAGTFSAWTEGGVPLSSEDYPLVRGLRGETVVGEVVQFERPDRSRAFIRANAGPLRDAEGNFAGAITTYYDITEIRRLQDEQDQERQRLHLTFQQAPVALAIFRGPEHRFEIANPRYEEMVGRQGLAGKAVRDAFPELAADHPVFQSLDRAYQGNTVLVTELQVSLRRGSRAEVEDAWFNYALQPLRAQDGKVLGSMVVAVDVTDQVLSRQKVEGLRAEAEAANRAKDQFLAILGHELRNPLAPILTALQLLRVRGLPGGERERAVIERQVQHLLRLVDDLLDVARVTRGNVELRRKPVELREIVESAVELASPLFEEKRQHLEVKVEPGLSVDADPARLRQAIANLLTNAARYTHMGGKILVSVAREAEDARIEVRDDGIGIPAELLPRIFDMFVQGERGFDRSQGGLGLGLSIVKSLVTLHGGHVEAHSEGPGKGSTFTIRLAALSELARPEEDRPSDGAQPGTARKVLIVDDNEDAAFMLSEAIRGFGHEVCVAHDGPSAIAAAARFTPEVALLDLGLPVMDGFDLARKLHAIAGLESLELIAVTGYGQPMDRERSREAGFVEHLVKPVDLEEIAKLLQGEKARAPPRSDGHPA